MSLDPRRWSLPVAIAHRGSRCLWPENTLIAFDAAVGLGYRHLETDLHITADGILVCLHDETVDRTTNGTGRVEDLTITQLKTLDAGYRHRSAGGYPFRGQGVTVPTLDELLTSLPEVSLIVDLKRDDLAEPLAVLIDDLGAHERLIVGSFSDQRLAEFRVLTDGKVPTSAGPAEALGWVLSSKVGKDFDGSADALQIPTHMWGVRVLDQRLVDEAHRQGVQVHVWTVNTESEMSRLLDMGVDGLISDRPDVLRNTLEQRGQWRP